MTQPRAENGRYRKTTVQERVAAHAAFLESVIVVRDWTDRRARGPIPFPIAEYLLALLGLAAILTGLGGIWL